MIGIVQVSTMGKLNKQLIVLLSALSIFSLLLQSVHFHGPADHDHEEGVFAAHHGCSHTSVEDRQVPENEGDGPPQIESVGQDLGCPICLASALNPFGVAYVLGANFQVLDDVPEDPFLFVSQHRLLTKRSSRHSRAPPFQLI
ncbi:MAG: hypothetical protein ACI97A_003174 [Planctomycetota bacterium]|jgi:hypothetical protein